MFKKPSLVSWHQRNSLQRRASSRLTIERLEDRRCLATDVQQLLNLNQTNPWGSIAEMASAGDYVYFVASETTAEQWSLWRTDGTTAGTLQLTTLARGVQSGNALTNVNGTLYFKGSDPEHGTELWKSDGSIAGTQLVRDLSLGSASSNLANFEPNGDELLFTKNGNLMRSNGKPSGTSQVYDFLPNAVDEVSSLERVGNSIYLKAKISATDYRLFKTDGTSAGTTAVRVARGGFSNLAKVGDSLYFTRESAGQTELWKTVGETDSAQLLKTNFPRGTDEFTDVNGKLYFNLHGQIGMLDGVEINSFDVGNDSFNLFNMNGVLYFAGGTEFLSDGYEPWKTDGTQAGTVMVKNIDTGFHEGYGFSSNPGSFSNVNGQLYFLAAGGLWTTDGTNTGTLPVESQTVTKFAQLDDELYLAKQLVGTPYFGLLKRAPSLPASVEVTRVGIGNGDSNPSTLVSLNGDYYFGGSDGITGTELWKYSPGTGTATLVQDIVPGAVGSNVRTLASINGSIYFSAFDPELGNGIWVSDGTAAGTKRLQSVMVMTTPGQDVFTTVGNDYFFQGYTDASGVELWKTDGTVSGTALIKDIYPGSTYLGQGYGFAVNSASPSNFVAFNNTLYFSAYDSNAGRELWKSDGTVEGTVLVNDLLPGGYMYYGNYGSTFVPYSSSPRGLNVLKGQLHFAAVDARGSALWRMDGTTETMVPYKRIGGDVRELKRVNNDLYFSSFSLEANVSAEMLWKTNGTAIGTVLVKEIRRGPGSRSMQSFTNAGGTLYFVANDGIHGKELWRSDGTDSGTILVSDISKGLYPISSNPRGSTPTELTFANGVLFFTADDGVNGRELWRTNGTEDGVTLVKSNESKAAANPSNLSVLDGKLYFAATGTEGREIWIASSIAPRLRQIASSVEYIESSSAAFIAPNAIVSDADSDDFSGGKLIIRFETDYLEGDQLLIRERGDINVVNNNVFDGESIIGRVIPNSGRSITIALNLNATAASVTKVLRSIAFRSEAVDVSFQARRVTLQLLDGDSGASDVRTVEVLLRPNSQPPALYQIDSLIQYQANGSSMPIAASARLVDADSPFLSGGSLSISISTNKQATDRLTLNGSSFAIDSDRNLTYQGLNIGLSESLGGADELRFQFNSQASIAIVQRLLRSIAFSSNEPAGGAIRSITISIVDGEGGSLFRRINVELI